MKVMSITVFSNSIYPEDNNALIFITDGKGNIEVNDTLSYNDGMKELRRLEQRTKKVAQMDINRYDVHVCAKRLTGIIE